MQIHQKDNIYNTRIDINASQFHVIMKKRMDYARYSGDDVIYQHFETLNVLFNM